MGIDNNIYLDFNDVLIKPKRSNLGSRSEVILERTINFIHSKQSWTGIPLMAANMDTTGTFEIYDVLSKHKMITVFHKHYDVLEYKNRMDTLNREYYSLSSGTSDSDYLKLQELITILNPKFVTIDVANGYSSAFIEFCKKVRGEYPTLTIFAGNIATSDMVQELILSAQVDVVKCGIGSGSVCSTRLKSGIGVPQLSVCMSCSEVANGLNGHIISDGGCTIPGDIAKAFGSGAHFVMLGGMIAGHTETLGDIITDENGKEYKLFYGMSSEHAQDKYNGGLQQYRSSEGKLRKIPFKGELNTTLIDILGGLRSAGTYIGANRLKDFPKCCTFLQVNRQVNTVYDNKDYLV